MKLFSIILYPLSDLLYPWIFHAVSIQVDAVHWIYGTVSQDIYLFLAHNSVTSLYFPIFCPCYVPSDIPDIHCTVSPDLKCCLTGYTVECSVSSAISLEEDICPSVRGELCVLSLHKCLILPPQPAEGKEGTHLRIQQNNFSAQIFCQPQNSREGQSPQGWHEWKSYNKEDNQDFLSAARNSRGRTAPRGWHE